MVRRNDEGEAQRRRWTFYEAINIAEGYRRGHRKEYIQFLYIAQGSSGELETLLSLSRDLGFIDEKSFAELHRAQDEISRLLRGLIKSLSKEPPAKR